MTQRIYMDGRACDDLKLPYFRDEHGSQVVEVSALRNAHDRYSSLDSHHRKVFDSLKEKGTTTTVAWDSTTGPGWFKV